MPTLKEIFILPQAFSQQPFYYWMTRYYELIVDTIVNNKNAENKNKLSLAELLTKKNNSLDTAICKTIEDIGGFFAFIAQYDFINESEHDLIKSQLMLLYVQLTPNLGDEGLLAKLTQKNYDLSNSENYFVQYNKQLLETVKTLSQMIYQHSENSFKRYLTEMTQDERKMRLRTDLVTECQSIVIRARADNDKETKITLQNTPSILFARNITVDFIFNCLFQKHRLKALKNESVANASSAESKQPALAKAADPQSPANKPTTTFTLAAPSSDARYSPVKSSLIVAQNSDARTIPVESSLAVAQSSDKLTLLNSSIDAVDANKEAVVFRKEALESLLTICSNPLEFLIRECQRIFNERYKDKSDWLKVLQEIIASFIEFAWNHNTSAAEKAVLYKYVCLLNDEDVTKIYLKKEIDLYPMKRELNDSPMDLLMKFTVVVCNAHGGGNNLAITISPVVHPISATIAARPAPVTSLLPVEKPVFTPEELRLPREESELSKRILELIVKLISMGHMSNGELNTRVCRLCNEFFDCFKLLIDARMGNAEVANQLQIIQQLIERVSVIQEAIAPILAVKANTPEPVAVATAKQSPQIMLAAPKIPSAIIPSAGQLVSAGFFAPGSEGERKFEQDHKNVIKDLMHILLELNANTADKAIVNYVDILNQIKPLVTMLLSGVRYPNWKEDMLSLKENYLAIYSNRSLAHARLVNEQMSQFWNR